jgi:nitrous oxide reductase
MFSGGSQWTVTMNGQPQGRETMRTTVLAACTAIGLGLVGVSAASAVPANLNAISEAATGDTLITEAYYYGHRYYRHRYYRHGYYHRRHCWWRYGYRHCRW